MIYKKNLEKITICQNHKENNEDYFLQFFYFLSNHLHIFNVYLIIIIYK